jgi:ABC-type multidrug transport system ATPase subunit
VRVSSISFSYPKVHVFSGWSHGFSAGLTWLQGRNGCGKSTLLKLLCGALALHGGDVSIGSVTLRKSPLAYRQRVFWCGPGDMGFDHLTPLEYIAFVRGLYGGLDEAALAAHVAGFGLSPFMQAPLAGLSSGTQHKVWLAVALSAQTELMLLDEPLNALDVASVAHLQAELAKRASERHRTCIVVSHEHLGQAAADATVFLLPLWQS